MIKFHVVVMILCIFASFSIIPWIHGFNVETKHYTLYNEERYSMFGFSVAEHLTGDNRGWVIVGAPQAETSQARVTRGGAVYRCEIDKDHSCTPIYFDVNGNNINTHPSARVEVDNKTMQWFGATVSTSYEPDGPILACAPRYKWYSHTFTRREPVGTCFITEHSFSEPKEFSPCRTKQWGYHRQGSCQAGLGAALTKDGSRVLIGAPGSYYWQGQTYSIDSKAEFKYIPVRFAEYGESSAGQTFSATTSNLARVYKTKESQAKEDDSYLGYSVTTGDFEGNGETGAAVGMPRGNGLHGQVVIFTANLTNYQKNLTGDQMGEYFGYSVIACDVNGDRLDDLIVGAPMYTIDNPGETFETGRVHIFYQENALRRFARTETRIGFKSRSRFGLSLASLGDIDRDGFGDFAVGAPYDGPEGRGAVYIYHGSRDGVLKTYSQVIYAEDIRPSMSTFGFSIGGGLDLDRNSYPDMVVGAYESSTAAFFRSRPVIKMDAWVTFESKSKSISLEDKDCILSNGVNVACLQLNTCLSYSGIGVQRSYQFNVEYALDTKKSKNRRLFFIDFERDNSINQTVRLLVDERICKSFRVFVDYNITDKLTSIDAEMRMSLIEDYDAADEFRNPKSQLSPVLGTTTSRSDTLSIFKSCGSDNICTPDLILNATSGINKYLLASGDRLEIDVLVNNTGEHAYEAVYYLEQPPGIEYINIERINKTGITVDCSAPSENNNYTIICNIGNPLPKDESVRFKVILQPIKSEGLKAYYELNMSVNSTNPELEDTREDNHVHFRMPIWIQTEIVIEGTSRPKDLYYNADNYTVENISSEWEFGPLLTHNYTIRNDGPSAIVEAEALLTWPAATLAGEELLYLIDMPETAGPITCQTANANYLSLKLDRKPIIPPIDGSFGGTNVDRINQWAEDERRKQNEEQPNFEIGNGTRDYNYDAGYDIVVTSSSAINGRNSTSSSSSSSSSRGGGGGYSGERHNSYVESRARGGGGVGMSSQNENQQNERLRIRLEQQREEERLRLESQQREANRLRVEQQRASEERIRIENERRLSENRRIEAEERLRMEAIARQRLNDNQHRGNSGEERKYDRTEVSSTYGVQKHYPTETENSSRQRTGYGTSSGEIVREEHEHSSGNINLSNIGSSKDLEKFFSTLNHDAAAITTHTRNGQEYVQFDGRFRVRDSQEYVQFRNGQSFAILDTHGEPSYSTGHNPTDSRYLSIEGKLVRDEDGHIYVELKDGRKFLIPGTYTYQRTHTFTVGGHGPQENKGTRRYTYGKQVTHEGSSSGVSDERAFEPFASNNYREESYNEEHKSGKRIITGTNSGNFDSITDTFNVDDIPTIRPEDRLNRYARESDMLNIEQFRKYERNERQKREDEHTAEIYPIIQRYRRDEPLNYGADDIGRGQVLSCKSAECVRLECKFGPLKKDQEVLIKVRYRVKAKTLNKIASNTNVKVSTKLVTRVIRQEFLADTPHEQLTKSHEILTTIHPSAAPAAPDVVPLWVVVLSACAGTIILLLLIFLLYKIGFFKRNRPNNAPERQPLNRNGHYSHDE